MKKYITPPTNDDPNSPEQDESEHETVAMSMPDSIVVQSLPPIRMDDEEMISESDWDSDVSGENDGQDPDFLTA